MAEPIDAADPATLARIATLAAEAERLERDYLARSGALAMAQSQAGLAPGPDDIRWLDANRAAAAAVAAELGPLLRRAVRPSRAQREFLRWFGFEPLAPAMPDTATCELAPAAAAFAPHVRLSLVPERTGAGIAHARLAIECDLADDPQRAPFVRDLWKSFLLAFVDGRDAERAGALALELYTRDVPGIVIRHVAAPRAPGGAPSAPYSALTGAGGPTRVVLDEHELRFGREAGGERPRAVVSIVRRAMDARGEHSA